MKSARQLTGERGQPTVPQGGMGVRTLPLLVPLSRPRGRGVSRYAGRGEGSFPQGCRPGLRSYAPTGAHLAPEMPFDGPYQPRNRGLLCFNGHSESQLPDRLRGDRANGGDGDAA